MTDRIYGPLTVPGKLPGKGDTLNDAKWTEFYSLYCPYICHIAKMRGLNTHDAEDIAQKVMSQLVEQMRTFEYDPKNGRFRGYLQEMTRCRIIDLKRKHNPAGDGKDRQHNKPGNDGGDFATSTIDRVPDPKTSETDKHDNDEWNKVVIRKAIAIMRKSRKISDERIQIFIAYCVEHQSPSELSAKLGITPNAIFLVKNQLMPLFETACIEAKEYVDRPCVRDEKA